MPAGFDETQALFFTEGSMTPETIIGPNGLEVVLVHWSRGDGRIACMPSLTKFSSELGRLAPHIRTESQKDVTCPLCKKAGGLK